MTNAHDPRTLEERLQWIADWSEPGIDLADAGTAREALDTIKALKAENTQLREALHRIEDASYINQLQGTANFERLQNIARAKLGEGTLDG